MEVKVELEMELDLKSLSFAEIQRIIKQLVETNESRMVKNATVKDFKIL